MNDERIIHQIHREIDGEITEAEKEKLHRRLLKDQKAQRLYRELIQLNGMLCNARRIEPSLNLRKRIMNSVDAKRRAIPRRAFPLPSRIFKRFIRPEPKMAFAFAFGVSVGVLLLAMVLPKNGWHVRNVSGTIGLTEQTGFKTLEQTSCDLTEVRSTWTVKQSGNILTVEVQSKPSAETRMVLEFEETRMRFTGFQPMSQGKITLENRGNRIQTIQDGDAAYRLLFRRESADASTFRINVFQAGQEKYAHAFFLKQTPEK